MTITDLTLPYPAAVDLAKRLTHTIRSRRILPLLQYALLDPAAGTITSSDLENWTVLPLPDGAADGPAVLIPVAALTKLLRAVKPAGAKAAREAVVTIQAGQGQDGDVVLNVTCSNGRLVTATDTFYPADDYPAVPSYDTNRVATVVASDLTAALAFAGSAVGRDDVLPMLTGVRVEPDPDNPARIVFAATDRYRLAATTVSAGIPVSFDGFLLPYTAAKAIGALAGTVDVRLSSGRTGYVKLVADNGTVWVRLIDATFPTWRSLIPGTADRPSWTVPTGRFAADAKATAVALGKHDPAIVNFTETGVALGSFDPIPADTTTPTVGHIGFTPRFLADAVAAFGSDTVTVSAVTGERKPVVFTGDRADGTPGTILLMPLNLDAARRRAA